MSEYAATIREALAILRDACEGYDEPGPGLRALDVVAGRVQQLEAANHGLTVELHDLQNRLTECDGRTARLSDALEKAADTFSDLAAGLELIGHPVTAAACEIVEEATRAVLAGKGQA